MVATKVSLVNTPTLRIIYVIFLFSPNQENPVDRQVIGLK